MEHDERPGDGPAQEPATEDVPLEESADAPAEDHPPVEDHPAAEDSPPAEEPARPTEAAQPPSPQPPPPVPEGNTRVVQAADGSVAPAAALPGRPSIPVDELGEADRLHEHPEERELGRVHLTPTLTLLLGAAAGIVAIAGLRSVASIVAPTFLSITLIIAFYPVYKLVRRLLFGPIAALLLIVLLYGTLAFLGYSLVVTATEFANELGKPRYADTFTAFIQDGRRQLLEWGVNDAQINNAISQLDLQSLTGVARSLADTLTGLTTTMIFLLTVMIFLVMDAGGVAGRMDTLHLHKPDLADALVDFGLRVRKYWIVSTIFGVIVAVIDYGALLWLEVPLALTFGFLAFVTNYIPNVGFVIGLVPPAFLGLLSGGVSTMLWVIGVYAVSNFVIQTILQPKFTGDAVGINATTAFLSLIFWSYVFGALGALLAIPFTLLVKTVLIDRDPRARWINQFIASDPRDDRSAQPV